MAADAKAVDIAGYPELMNIAEEVRATREPRVLRRGDEDIARIVPLRIARRRKAARKSSADYKAFLGSAGSWSDVDIDAFLKANRESRDRSTRPSVEL